MTFDDEVAYLKAHGDIEVLESPGGGRVAVSPSYQARVMTSEVEAGGNSLGFVNHTFIDAGKTGTQFDNYGGEDRFWLGPEGGQFGLYFPPGKPFVFDQWQTPQSLQKGTWAIRERSAKDILFEYAMDVTNWSGNQLHVRVRRDVRLLDGSDIAKQLATPVPEKVKWVAFETVNAIESYGENWTKDRGVPSIWILGMYQPAPDMRVVIPFDPAGTGDIVNDKYFGKVPPDRLKVDAENGYLVFSCDGHHRSKIGLGPTRAKSVAGSYSASAKLLTIVQYDKPAGATDYVNSMWEQQASPFGGDVVNSYNDGPTEPGKPALGGFYELETSSPAAVLPRGQSIRHTHRTFHFVGERDALDAIATSVLGVSLSKVSP
jgi:hypothetical protein